MDGQKFHSIIWGKTQYSHIQKNKVKGAWLKIKYA